MLDAEILARAISVIALGAILVIHRALPFAGWQLPQHQTVLAQPCEARGEGFGEVEEFAGHASGVMAQYIRVNHFLLTSAGASGRTGGMTEDQARAREQAAHDLADIAALRSSLPFNRYFLPRLERQRDKLADAVLNSSVAAPDREGLRQRYQLINDEILRWMGTDEASAQRLLEQVVQ